MEDYITVSAKTLDDAITEALVQLGVTSDRLDYIVVEKGSEGFLGIGRKQAVIKARRKREEKPVEETVEESKVETPVKEEVKPEKKTEKKPAAKSNKAAAKTAKTAKADKEEASGVNVVVEFNGTQRKVDDIVAKIKDEWVAAGHRLSTIKTLDVYVKPQDYTAYYVINGKIEGKVWM